MKHFFSKRAKVVLVILLLLLGTVAVYRQSQAVNQNDLINSSDLIVEGNTNGGGPSDFTINITRLYKGTWPDNPGAQIHIHTPYIGLHGGEDLHGLFFLKSLDNGEYEVNHGTLGWYISSYHASEFCRKDNLGSVSTVAGFNAISSFTTRWKQLVHATSGELSEVNKQVKDGTLCTDSQNTLQPLMTKVGIANNIPSPTLSGLTVIYPNNGEVLIAGQEVEVKWNNTTGKEILVTLLKEDEYQKGRELSPAINNILPLSATATTTKIRTYEPGTYRVMLKTKDDYRYKAVGTHTFTITDKTLTISSPDAANHLTMSKSDTWGIQWRTPPGVNEVSVSLCPWGVQPTSSQCVSLGRHPAMNTSGFWEGDTGNRNGVAQLHFPKSLPSGDYFILIFSGDKVGIQQDIDYDIGARLTVL